MKGQSNQKFDKKNFHEFVDEDSPEEAAKVERKWKADNLKKRNWMFTKVMIGAIVVVAIIFVFVIRVLGSMDVKKHREIDYNDQRYRMIESQLPHLKYLILRDTPTIQTRLIRGTGALYPELMAWIESEMQASKDVLLLTNQKSGQAMLAITIGYYLRVSAGGQLTIVADEASYKDLLQKNLEEMRKQHGKDRFPIKIISKKNLDISVAYDLVVCEKTELPEINWITNFIVIRNENAGNSIAKKYKQTHQAYEITKGKVGGDIRFSSWFNFALIPYNPTKQTNTYIIWLANLNYIQDYPICTERNANFKDREEDRNLIQFLRNRTFTNASIYYEFDDSAIAASLAKLPSVTTIYQSVGSNWQLQKNKYIQSIDDMYKLGQNYYFLKLANVKPIKGVKIITRIQSQVQMDSLKKIFPSGYKLQWISPYNNKCCYFPPQIISPETFNDQSYAFVEELQSNEIR